jgi:transcriptional regulator with XRE-family HTH domain
VTPKEHAIALLAQGIPTSQVAAACGVSDAYISQLKADDEVQSQILAKQAAHTSADLEFDQTLEDAEALALDKIKKNLPFANMGQALAAFRVLNGARRRKDEIAQTDNSVSLTVNLTLPAAALPRYITNSSNEIVEVEGKTMISASAKTLDQILAARSGGDTSLPQTTALEKAADILDRLSAPKSMIPVAKVRRSPLPLSADVL